MVPLSGRGGVNTPGPAAHLIAVNKGSVAVYRAECVGGAGSVPLTMVKGRLPNCRMAPGTNSNPEKIQNTTGRSGFGPTPLGLTPRCAATALWRH